MKKSIYFIASCAVALASCSQTDVIEESIQSNAIGFENNVSKPGRADLTKGTMDHFYVYAYYTKGATTANPVNVFEGEEVTLSGTTWGYSNTRYWIPDATYYFYAYSCGNNALTTNGDPSMDLEQTELQGRALKIYDFKCNDSHQDDLVVAKNIGMKGQNPNTDGTTANAKVGFNFKHALTKINAVFTSDFAPDYQIEISNVRIRNIYDIADFDAYEIPTNKADNTSWNNWNPWSSWSRSTGTATVAAAQQPKVLLGFTTGNNIASKNATETEAPIKATTQSAFVIPHHYTTSTVYIDFTIKVKQNDQVFLSRDMTGSWKPDWKTGYSYTYNIVISGTTTNLEPIVFETQDNMNIDGWNESPTNIDFNFSAN